MTQNLENYTEEVFERIKHVDEDGNEFWYARELQQVFEYKQWRRFNETIERAKINCKNSNYTVSEQFAIVGKLSKRNNNSIVEIKDYRLTRYACYLIALNGDPKKEIISLAKTYFSIQTRRIELLDEEFKELSEDDKRLKIRKQVKKGNYGLNRTAIKSGVKNLAEFHNAGYKGLYNGETADDIFKRKGLKYRQDILDYMGSSELAANLFRITQTDDKLKRDKVNNEYEANLTHYNMGKDIREFIKKQGGTMPEDLPNPRSPIKEIDKK